MKPQTANSENAFLRKLYALKARFLLLIFIFFVSFFGILLSHWLTADQIAFAKIDIMQPAPTQPIGYYDFFGELLSPQQAAELVEQQGLDPNNPTSYQQVGAVEITQELIAKGEDIFFKRKIGDTFGLQGVFGFGQGVAIIRPEISLAITNLQGQPTTNLQITLQKDITIGSRTFPKGTVVNTGLQVERGATNSLGATPDGNLTCAVCHVVLNNKGERLVGVPNGVLGLPLFIALSPNTAAGFARLNFNPLDPQYQGNGKTIIDSQGRLVQLPDPQKFEKAFDDAVLDVPFGNFESSPDSINNTTQIPSLFTFKTNPYVADGHFAVGPFAGLTSANNGVHSSEINLLFTVVDPSGLGYETVT